MSWLHCSVVPVVRTLLILLLWRLLKIHYRYVGIGYSRGRLKLLKYVSWTLLFVDNLWFKLNDLVFFLLIIFRYICYPWQANVIMAPYSHQDWRVHQGINCHKLWKTLVSPFYPTHSETKIWSPTRRYRQLRGLASSSCGGLRPTAEAFYAVFPYFRPCLVFSSNLSKFD